MKKVLFCVIVLLSIFAIACNNKTDNNDVKEPEAKEIDEKTINDLLDAIKVNSRVDSDINLAKSINVEGKEYTITWVSDNEAILSSNGKVNRQAEDIDVKLTAKVLIDGIEYSKTFDITVLKKETNYDAVLDDASKLISIPKEISEDIELKEEIDSNGFTVRVKYAFSSEALSSAGKVKYPVDNDKIISASVTLSIEDKEKTVELDNIKVLSMKSLCEKTSELINIGNVVDDDIELIEKNGPVSIEWATTKPRVLSNKGVCAYVTEDTNVTLSATIYMETTYGEYFIDKQFNITVKEWNFNKRCDIAYHDVNIPDEATKDLDLPYNLGYNLKCLWTSSDDTVISSIGRVYPKKTDETITLIATVFDERTDEKRDYVYTVVVPLEVVKEDEEVFRDHNLVVYAKDFKKENFNNLVFDETDGRVKLASGALTGEYESVIYNIHDTYEVVGSYQCITSPNATCECGYSLRVDGKWSKYFTYGDWGLGKANYYYDTSDSLVSMSVDEIEVRNNKTADAIKFKFTLRRNNANTDSPALGMVACALFIENYRYAVDKSAIKDQVDWDVPKLYQHDVPEIGGVICSPTTTTMLLKYKGLSFKDKGYRYEHEYIARMAADPGHNSPTYGNWSYNMITAGAFGVNAYFARVYSFEELCYHLSVFGPVGVSIRGNFGIYSTNGHLIVVRGYRIEKDNTIVICNDPNVRGVYYEVTLDVFMGAWRNNAYYMEF